MVADQDDDAQNQFLQIAIVMHACMQYLNLMCMQFASMQAPLLAGIHHNVLVIFTVINSCAFALLRSCRLK